MSSSRPSSAERREIARQALAAADRDPKTTRRVTVQCARGHHVAVVRETDAGVVYQAVVGPRARGSKDFVDTGHQASPIGSAYVDFLDVTPLDEPVPAWCGCGSWTVVRGELLAKVREGRRTIHLPMA